MHKMTVRSAERFALLENSDFIAHAAIAQFSHLKARFNGVRKSDRREILALGFDNEADDGAIMHIKQALLQTGLAVPADHDKGGEAPAKSGKPWRRDSGRRAVYISGGAGHAKKKPQRQR